uniref:Energy-coupling factor transporter transmembrane protein EcfT n=1 Tax=Thermofilum pendens TaxID=2269 RepID=A0A7C3SKD8_THEPE
MTEHLIRYVEGTSVVHKLDPRTKFFFVLSIIVCTSIAYHLALVLPLLTASLAFYAAARLPWKSVRATWKFVLLIILFLSLLNYLFVAVLFHPQRGQLSIEQALEPGLLLRVVTPVVKLLTIAAATITLVYTTPYNLYAPALGQMGISYKAAYVIQLGLRYLPEFMGEMRKTLEAQMARGYRPRGGRNIFARILSLAPLVVPVTISATLSIYDIADAMELRGFGERQCHTWYRRLRMGRTDRALALASAATLLAYAVLFVLRPI